MVKSMIVVSLRSKGLASYNWQTLLDIKGHAVDIAFDVLDIVLAAIMTVFALSWNGWISVIITIIVVSSFPTSGAAYPLDGYFLFFAYVVLPILVMIAIVMKRREDALVRLSRVKSLVVAICLAGSEGPPALRDAHEEVRRRVFLLLECLHRYLQHKRPYTRHFFLPWRPLVPGPTDPLLMVSRELGVLLRRVHRGVREAHVACQRLGAVGGPVGETRGAMLSHLVTELHDAVEGLSSIKEMRTPVILRAVLRWFSVLIIPVFLGPFINLLRQLLGNNSVTPGSIVVLSQIALMVLLDVLIGMEDPFDDAALDTISLFEMMDHISAMTAEGDGDAGGAMDGHLTTEGAPRGMRSAGDGAANAVRDTVAPSTTGPVDATRFSSVEMLSANGMAMPPMPMPPLPSAVGNNLYGVTNNTNARWHDTIEGR